MKAWSCLRRIPRDQRPAAAYFAGWTLYFVVFWIGAILPDGEGGISAGHVNIWGDWAIHFTMGSAMAFRELFLDENPLLIGSPFKYPFFVNFVSAALVRAGAPFFASFTVPSFFFCLFSVFALHRFYGRLLGSSRAAVVASMVFLLNGGMGFLKFIQQVASSASPLATLFAPPEVYTNLPRHGIYWINVIQSMFIPQRSFQLGFPVTLMVLAAVLRERGPGLSAEPASSGRWSRPKAAVWLGAILGFTPIVHTHSFLCGSIIVGTWALWDLVTNRKAVRGPLRWWGAFFAGMLAVSLPLLFKYFLGAENLSIFKWRPGWYADDGRPWVLFWWKNWGATLVAGVLGFGILLWRGKARRSAVVMFLLPFVALFAVSNLYVLHAWIWDNTKIFVWCSVGFSGVAAAFLAILWKVEGRARLLAKPFAIIALAGMCLSGAIDVYRILVPSLNRHTMYTNEDLFLADWARRSTPVDSVWLTGDYHNNWLFNLTGRQPVETYLGWLWTHGYNYKPVDRDVETMYLDPTRDDLFRKYGIDYIIVGQYEMRVMSVNRQEIERRFPVAMRTENHTVYRYTTAGEAERPPRLPKARPPLPLTASLRPGLVRRTYVGTYFHGKPLIKEGDSDINFEYADEDVKPFPVPGSIEWEGFLRIPAGRSYRFSLESDDGAWLYVDEVMLIDNGGAHPAQVAEATVALSEGFHHLRLRYFDKGGMASLKFGWSAMGADGSGGSEGLFH